MTITELILISFGLAMDCFAVAVGLGACKCLKWKDTLVMASMFGLFQGLMPLGGWLVGSSVRTLIDSMDHWIAFTILVFIGLKMIWQSFTVDEQKKPTDIKKISVLLTLSIATSIDAMVTGVGFGLIEVNIVLAILLITIVTFFVSVAGAKIGEKTTFIPARWAEFSGGLVLIAIGTKVLADHLMG
jgi:putative Mn2+ efflux pump MntP